MPQSSLEVAPEPNRAEQRARTAAIGAPTSVGTPANGSITHTELPSISTSKDPGARKPAFGHAELVVYRDDLFRRAMCLTRDASRADDLVQDTFERALGRVDRLPADSTLRGWLYVIMSNRFLDLMRAQKRQVPMPLDDVAVPDDEEDSPWWAHISPTQLKAAVQHLSPEIRSTFEMREQERLSYTTIASRQGLAVATVGTRLSRARVQLRQILSAGLSNDEEGAR